MNRISEILFESVATSPEQIIHVSDYQQIDNIFAQVDSGTDEQLAYFPLNPDNQIFKRYGIVPKIKTASINHQILCNQGSIRVDGSLNNTNGELFLQFIIDFYLDEKQRMNTYIATVTNKQAKPGNKNKNVAARLINTLQIFSVYSQKPGKLHLLTDHDGRHYWSKWFDFDYNDYVRELFLKNYAEYFENSLYGMGYHGKKVHNIISGFQTPIDFRYVNEQLGVSNTEIGKTCMKNIGINWTGKCGLQEMSDTNSIWEKGKYVLLSNGIRPQYPDDFQKVIAKKLAEQKTM